MLVVAGCGVVGLGAISISVPAAPVPDPDPEAAVVGAGVAISVGSDTSGLVAWVVMLTEGTTSLDELCYKIGNVVDEFELRDKVK